MSIGERIKNRRIFLKMDLKQLSKKTGISVMSLKQYEDGKVKIPESNIRKISYNLGITEAELKCDDTDNIKKIKFNNIWTVERLLDEYKSLDNFAKIKVCQVIATEKERIKNK